MSRPDSQRRRFRRHDVDDVHGSVLFRLEVKVLNLSLSGIAVETTEQLKLGKVYSMKLGSGANLVEVASTVRWCHLVGTRRRRTDNEFENVYRVGLTFDEAFTGKTTRLLEFMEKHVVLSVKKRLVGRFKVESAMPAAITNRFDFEVVKLSLSGMLVRSEFVPEIDSRFAMELRIGDQACEVTGRVVSAERLGGDSAPAEFGVEFVGEGDARSRLVRELLSEELV